LLDFVIFICGHGDTKDQTAWSITQCYERLPLKFKTAYIKDDALIGRSRSVAATKFLQANESEYLIFIDSDQAFTPDELERLFIAMREGYDIIAGAYGLGDGSKFAVGFDGVMTIDGQIHPCKYLSTGFMGISRKAFLTIRDKLNLPLLHKGQRHECYPFFESGRYEPEMCYISEDWDFCNKARKAGFTCYLHTGVLVDHVKEHTIIAEDVLKRTQIAPPTINPESSIIADLAEFLEKPLAEIKEEVVFHGKRVIKNDVDWLYDLAQFNSYQYYEDQRLESLNGLKGMQVLDYGCGIGTAVLKLSANNAVMGYDQNPLAIKFAIYRATKHHFINAHFVDQEPDLGVFNVITFIDVLEHFEDLRGFLLDFGKKVKKGTRVFHFDAFFDHETVGHFDHSAMIDEYIAEAGFIKFNDFWMVKI
jgi:hypothetical protein